MEVIRRKYMKLKTQENYSEEVVSEEHKKKRDPTVHSAVVLIKRFLRSMFSLSVIHSHFIDGEQRCRGLRADNSSCRILSVAL